MSLIIAIVQESFILIRFRLAELISDKAFNERRIITFAEIAEATGIHRATLSKMANQPGAKIGSEIIDKLCSYFDCQPGELMVFIKGSD
jgi:putative transcriptional regulator